MTHAAMAMMEDLDKDTVRRILAVHYKPDPASQGPSWFTTLGHARDSLWSVDLFRAESITLKTHWIMVVMDQYTRRMIGFAVHAGNVDGPAPGTGAQMVPWWSQIYIRKLAASSRPQCLPGASGNSYSLQVMDLVAWLGQPGRSA